MEAWKKLTSVARDHPYVAGVVTLVAAASAWAVYDTKVVRPARRKQRELEHRLVRVNADTPFGLGFKNCPERVEAIELVVEGEMPQWLAGKLFRSGPGTFAVETQLGSTYLIDHWFDGLTIMHGFEIRNGRVYYANRKAARETEAYIARYGGDYITVGPDPCKSTFEKLFTLFSMRLPKDPKTGGDPVNIGVTIKRIGGRLYNHTDANMLMEFDPRTLETTGRRVTFASSELSGSRRLSGPLSCAHGQYDARRREYVNYVCDIGARESTYTVFRISDDDNATSSSPSELCSFKAIRGISYMHSFAMTEDYVILQAWPLYIDPKLLLWHKSVMQAMTWHGDKEDGEGEPARFYVIHRKSGSLVHMYEVPPGFCFHNVNAWQEDEDDGDGDEGGGGVKIVMDLMMYEDGGMIHDLLLDRILSAKPRYARGALERITLRHVSATSSSSSPSSSSSVERRVLFNNTVELPRINVDRHMHPYTFVYGLTSDEGGDDEVKDDEEDEAKEEKKKRKTTSAFLNRIVKVNVRTGDKLMWGQEGLYPAEPIFIKSPPNDDEGEKGHDDEEEDRGILLSIVLDGASAQSFLLVLDARDLHEIARANVPHHIPFGFHGNFFGDTDLQTSDMS